jgi:hypothetical protein
LRLLIVLLFITFVIASPTNTFAAGHKKTSATEKTLAVIKKNPGASAGVAACGIAVAFFPPALLVCGGTLAAGLGLDQARK